MVKVGRVLQGLSPGPSKFGQHGAPTTRAQWLDEFLQRANFVEAVGLGGSGGLALCQGGGGR